MNIGKLTFNGNLILAPMAGITNLPMRLLCKRYGASLVYSEMISSEAVVRGNRESTDLGFTSCEEKPFGVQLMGSDPDTLVQAALILHNVNPVGLFDMNLGCPARDIIRAGCGCKLLKKPLLIGKIIQALSDSLDVPVTAKIRILNCTDENLNIARIIERSGADALIVHGRTQNQGYSGRSNLDVIRDIKKELSIPVIANGDISDELTARHVLDHTQCDGLMIGRAAIGNPYIFRRISHYLEKEELLPPGEFDRRLDNILEYIELCRKYNMLTFNDLKLKSYWFLKNRENIKSVRKKINEAKNMDSIMGILGELRNQRINPAATL
ncbi:MAG: tRNA-dihydrouridine synthase family protein [Candidatus Methanoperedens sp.]|nr:tRNA-dihydrouridine synthase family protein [Candidatus Methanoperedens sp.]